MSRTTSRMLAAMKGGPGKGDHDRVANSGKFRDNYSSIDWSRKTLTINDKENKHHNLKLAA